MHRPIYLSLLILITISLLAGCTHSNSVQESDIVGKTYTYEKPGFGGDFTIQIKEDGTFSYYEGMLSSYIGRGTWTLEGDTLFLSDDIISAYARDNYFKVDGEDLVFQSQNSTNFLYLEVADGERFTGSPTEPAQSPE